MKKLFIFIMLLCSCIVFTGCGGNSNSYDETDVRTLRISVSDSVINGNSSNSSSRASLALNDLKLLFNGVEFPGHSTDNAKNYIFTKVLYASELNEIIAGASSSTVTIFDKSSDKQIFKFIFALVDFSHSSDLAIIKDKSGVIKVAYDDQEFITIDDDDNLNEVTRVSVEKIDKFTVRVTFYNVLNNSIGIEYDSWQISALDSDLEVLASWDSSKNNYNNKLSIKKDYGFSDKSYIVSLTEDGKGSANSHNLDNTIVNIDYIRKDGLDVVNTGLLKQATWYPNK